MKNYFLLKKASEPNIIGVKNGVYQAKIKKEKITKKSSFDDMLNLFRKSQINDKNIIKNKDLDIEYVELLKGAKITDVLYFSPFLKGCFGLFNQKAKDIFQVFKLPKHNFFEALLYDKDSNYLETYQLLYHYSEEIEVINFKESIFKSGFEEFGNVKYYQFNNYEDYLLKKDSIDGYFFRIDKIKLKDTFDFDLDFFHIPLAGYFVSEDLKNAIEKNLITGIYVLSQHFSPAII